LNYNTSPPIGQQITLDLRKSGKDAPRNFRKSDEQERKRNFSRSFQKLLKIQMHFVY
jgi:hypothetical protein